MLLPQHWEVGTEGCRSLWQLATEYFAKQMQCSALASLFLEQQGPDLKLRGPADGLTQGPKSVPIIKAHNQRCQLQSPKLRISMHSKETFPLKFRKKKKVSASIFKHNILACFLWKGATHRYFSSLAKLQYYDTLQSICLFHFLVLDPKEPNTALQLWSNLEATANILLSSGTSICFRLLCH